MPLRRHTPTEARTLWRISNHADLSGKGGLLYPARWHTAGRPVVYLAETPAGALLETLVHLELDETRLPRHYQLLQVSVPSGVNVEALSVPQGNRWKSSPNLTQSLGDAWLESANTLLARVPSAILPHTANYLLNPVHPDASRVRITERKRAQFDLRLLPK